MVTGKKAGYIDTDAVRSISVVVGICGLSHLIPTILTVKLEARSSAESEDERGNVRILKGEKVVQNNNPGNGGSKWTREV